MGQSRPRSCTPQLNSGALGGHYYLHLLPFLARASGFGAAIALLWLAVFDHDVTTRHWLAQGLAAAIGGLTYAIVYVRAPSQSQRTRYWSGVLGGMVFVVVFTLLFGSADVWLNPFVWMLALAAALSFGFLALLPGLERPAATASTPSAA